MSAHQIEEPRSGKRKTARNHPEFLFLTLALPFGLLLVFLTPPFQVPDEPSHFYRAWQISEGRFSPVRHGDQIGADLPESIPQLAARFWYLTERPDARITPAQILSAREIRLGSPRAVAKSIAAPYLPVGYAPLAAAIAIARLLTDRPLDLLYAARIGNLIAATILCFLAIRISPVFRWVILLVAVLPISVYLRSSVSLDAVVISLALLTFALVVRVLLFAERSGLVKLIVSATFLSLLKPYGSLALIVLGGTDARKRLRLGLIALIVAIAAGTAILATHSSRYQQPPSQQVDSSSQTQIVLSDPIRFVRILTVDYIKYGPRYAAHMGRLGWLDAQVSLWIVGGCLIALFTLALTDWNSARSLSPIERLAILIVVLANLTMVGLSQYLTWTPVGAGEISGMQGRYLLPIAPFALMLFSNTRLSGRAPGRTKVLITMVASTFSLVATALTIWSRYYER